MVVDKFHRIDTALKLIKSKNTDLILFTLHSDPDKVFTGGTEGHVKQLRALLLNANKAVLILAPTGNKNFVLRGSIGEKIFSEEFFHQDSLVNLISVLELYVDNLHVHHTMEWSAVGLEALSNSAIKIKIVTAHDFWFLCPSITLLTEYHPERFCEVERDLKKCNNCLATKWKRPHETIQQYRSITLKFLEKFDRILVPSVSLLPYFKKAYGSDWDKLLPKVNILPHDLSYLEGIYQANKVNIANTKNKFTFIGALDGRKGSNLLLAAIPELEKQGFKIEILGSIFPRYHPNLKNTQIKLYKSAQELSQLLSDNGGPDFLGYISIWAETFSYTFFEGLLLCPTAIPIAGPYGNPAYVCHEKEIGVVMSACTPTALIDAVYRAKTQRDGYQKKLENYVEGLRKEIHQRSYLADYLAVTHIAGHASKSIMPISDDFLTQASIQDELLQKHEATLLNTLRWKIKKLRRIFERVRRVGWLTAFRHLRGLI